jgi:hypothetical protein
MDTTQNQTELRWRKSSYSGDGECVECAALDGAQWRKSSYNGATGASCVEVAKLPDAVAIRDSKTPGGPVLTVSPAALIHTAVAAG